MSLRICMVSDFFYPNSGGVESHIYQLSQCLIQKGHYVVVMTHCYKDLIGVRYMDRKLKVYYLPLQPVYNQCVLPTVFATLPLMRRVLIRERIDIVHGHSAFSALAHEAMFHAQSLGLHTVFTDHSLFGFADVSSVLTNALLQYSITSVGHVICVSHTSKENTVLRASIHPHNVSVIPNAVDATQFEPDPTRRTPGSITVVIMSRLVYRKGADIIAAVIPIVCRTHPDVRFIVGGDGPKRQLIEEAIDKHDLCERVEMLGAVEHSAVRNVLVRGDIFLNASLTEAFCIAIVEAACCGLVPVSTRVGGVPEVLPPDLIRLTEPSIAHVAATLDATIGEIRAKSCFSPLEINARVRDLYKWEDVARRTDIVYNIVRHQIVSQNERLNKYRSAGFIFGHFFVFLAVINQFLIDILNYLKY